MTTTDADATARRPARRRGAVDGRRGRGWPASPRRRCPASPTATPASIDDDPRAGARRDARARLPAQQRRAGAASAAEFHTIGVIMFTPVHHRQQPHASRRSPRTPRREGYAITLIPVAAPTQDERARARSPGWASRPSTASSSSWRSHLLDARDGDAAARRARGRRRLRRRRPLHRRRHRPGRRRPPGRPSTCSTSATAPSGTSPGPRSPSPPSAAPQAWRATLERGRPAGAAGAARRLVGRVRLPGRAAPWPTSPTCTAVFAANDQMALGVLRALHERGRAVPGDVSVVGFDDMPDAALASSRR